MLGKRMPRDTLYLIFEEDFRFEDDYDVVGERWVLQIKMDKSAYRSKTDLPPVVAKLSCEQEAERQVLRDSDQAARCCT